MISTLELQKQLICKIQITTDEDMLASVLRLLEFETAIDEQNVFNEEQKNAINKARQQVANGKFFTDEEVDKLTEKWVN
jgi:predicted transcriptional regulator